MPLDGGFIMNITKRQRAIQSAAIVVIFAARRMLELARQARSDAAIQAATTVIAAMESIATNRG